jgi:hypothetical protein
MAHLLRWLQSVVRDTGEPYLPSLVDRTLSTVIAYPYSDQTYPWPPESRLRLVLTRDYLLFIQQSILRGLVIRLRVAPTDLLSVRLAYFPVADETNSLSEFLVNWALFGDIEARQFERHYELLRAVTGPPRVECIEIRYRDKGRYDGEGTFVGLQPPRGSGMSLRESAYRLGQVIRRGTLDG